jgi:DNA-binding CsgD family transcriptional regulator
MLPKLTDREEQILRLIADGLTNKEISCSLTISAATVENHVYHIFAKLGISNHSRAVAYAFQTNNVMVNKLLKNKGNPS